MTPKRFAVPLLCLALAAPTAANAGLITWELEGTIEQVGPSAPHGGFIQLYGHEVIPQLEAVGVTPGASWSARVRFESDTVAVPCVEATGCAEFYDATRSVEFQAGSFAAGTPDGIAAGDAVVIPLSFSPNDGSLLRFLSVMVSNSGTLFVDSATLALASLDSAEFPDDALPTEPPDVSGLVPPAPDLAGAIVGTRFSLTGRGLVRNSDTAIFFGGPMYVQQPFAIDGRITRISPVPEPSLFALVLASAAASAIRRRSRALP